MEEWRMASTRRIGVITAYLEQDWHSQQLVAAVDRCAEAVVIRPEQLGAQVMPEGVSVVAADVELASIDGYILARGFGERGNADFLVPVYQLLERAGHVLVNSINALLVAIDKFETSARLRLAGVATPRVVVVQDVAMARAVVRAWGRAVAKPLFGSLGLGIELVEDTPQGYALLPVLMERFGAIYLQEYVPTPGRDIRAFVVGSRVAASIYRVAMPGAWRTNLAQGGAAEPCQLEPATAALAVNAARAVGLDYTGIDILEGPDGPVVIEVNGNPLWHGVLQATGQNMAQDIVAWVIERITQPAMKGGECLA